MFQFPSLPPAPYVFRCGYARITTREFPHSEILGSKDGQLLPQAFRSRPRPSSALGAKASIVCPCSLDQKNTGIDVAMEFSRCARARARPTENAGPRAGLSKLSSEGCLPGDTMNCVPGVQGIEVDMLLGEPGVLTVSHTGTD